jgi:hypothetical protein
MFETGRRPTAREAFELLSRALYEKMEHLEPSNRDGGWGDLQPREKEFYYALLEELLARKEIINIALESPDHGVILGRS